MLYSRSLLVIYLKYSIINIQVAIVFTDVGMPYFLGRNLEGF